MTEEMTNIFIPSNETKNEDSNNSITDTDTESTAPSLTDKQKKQEYFKQYHINHKEQILKKQAEKYKCPYCNREMRRDTKHKHEKTKRCLYYQEIHAIAQRLKYIVYIHNI